MLLRTPMFLAVAAVFTGGGAFAMGFGRAPTSVLLGSPLSFAVPVRLDMGDSLAPECVGAEVQIGDRKLLPGDVRVRLEPGGDAIDRVVRVTSAIAVDEPVVAVTVHVGCSGRMSRRFTAFADPPPSVTPPVVAESQPVAPAAAPVAAELPREVQPAADSGGVAAGAPPLRSDRPRRERRERSAAQRPVAPRSTAARAAGGDRQALAAAPRAVGAGDRLGDAIDPSPAPRKFARASPDGARTAAVVGTGGARLRLEAADPEVFTPRRPDAGAAAPALSPALSELLFQSDAAASAAARVQALERSVEQLMAESKANRDAMAAMRARVSETDFAARALPWLGGALAIVSGLALWLGWNLRRSRAEQQAWWAQEAVAPAGPVPGEPAAAPAAAPVPSVSVVERVPVGESASDRMPLESAPTMPMNAPLPLPAARVADDSAVFDTEVIRGPAGLPQREVAIDELIDLEQQADFFVALGQEDAAIDLLVGHIRGSGGTSPMAYLKLLEIYRRKGDAENYDRTRTRFNHRFNAFAPDWDTGLQSGRELEQYPEVMQRLQAVWPDPLDAMAELEALMFRRDDGELFDLPAYRELLFLFSLARDNLDKEGGRPNGVDLLLPLADAGALPQPDMAAFSLDLPNLDGGARVDGAQPLEPAGFTLDSSPGGLDLNLASGPAPLHDEPATDNRQPARVVDTDLDLQFLDPAPPPTGPSRR